MNLPDVPCPHCHGGTRVLDVRHIGEFTHRRRQCVDCGAKFTTRSPFNPPPPPTYERIIEGTFTSY